MTIAFTEIPKDKKLTLVAMSGGVDSSLAAGLLKEAGVPVVGVTLHLWDAGEESQVGRCCAPEDRDDARKSCEHLGIAHYVMDERESFRKNVVDPFIQSYTSGETPSPCVHCNRTVKLEQLVHLADQLGAKYIATGHYVRVLQESTRTRLFQGKDKQKDQSYFLYGVSQKVLSRMVFPLGGLEKNQSREEAERLGLPNAQKPDSQELCFVPDGDVTGFINKQGHDTGSGLIRDQQGNELGRHDGIVGFTLGQRKGINIGGGPAKYVLNIVPDTHDIVVGSEEALYSKTLFADKAEWLRERPKDSFRASVKVRYRHSPELGTVTPKEDGFEVQFDEPQRAITPGQAAVIYKDEEVIGGGFIVPQN